MEGYSCPIFRMAHNIAYFLKGQAAEQTEVYDLSFIFGQQMHRFKKLGLSLAEQYVGFHCRRGRVVVFKLGALFFF